MRTNFLLAALAAASLLAPAAQAQLAWSAYTTGGDLVGAAGSAAAFDPATGTYTFTVPGTGNTTLAFVTANFVPYNIAAASSSAVVTFDFNVSGGIAVTSGTRPIAWGLFNDGGTSGSGNLGNDVGYYGQWNPSTTKFETFSRSSGASLLTGGNSAGSGSVGTQSGTLANGVTSSGLFRLIQNSTATGIQIGNSATPGIGVTGNGLNRASYTNPVTPLLGNVVTFNEFALQYANTTGSAVTIQLSNVSLVGPPYLSAQPPANSTVSVGNTLTLSATAAPASQTANYTYQWQKSADNVSFSPIAGATGASYTVTAAETASPGVLYYRLTVTNAVGSATSNTATINVSSGAVAPSFQAQPASQTALVGGSPSFSVTATGTAPLTYQWQKGGVNLADGPTGSGSTVSGAATAALTIANAQLSDAGSYQAVVTNSAGMATSNAATLAVNQAPFFTTQPVGATLNAGDNYTLTAAAGGTPAPTYQWYKNGAAISGATGPSLTLLSVTGSTTGNYTVVATNSVAIVTSAVASIAVLSQTLSATTVSPNTTAPRNPDARLSITFNNPVSYGVSGFIRIYDAATNAAVDSIDLVAATNAMNTLRAASTVSTLAAPVASKNISGLNNMNYYPILISGNTATIYPRNNVLAYGKAYYVTVDAGVFVDSAGAAFAGISAANNTSAWAFSTKAAGPSASASALTVAADGSGDFDTVQAALDFVPASNTTLRTIVIRKGMYFEELYVASKALISLVGEDRAQTLIVYPNNERFNPSADSLYHRTVMQVNRCPNFTTANLSIRNSTPKAGTQAEALLYNGVTTSQGIVTGVNLYSYQDTLQLNGQAYVSNSYIEGDVDFMWGNGPNFYFNCQIKILSSAGYFTQIRNPATNHGNVYLNCALTAADGVTNTFLGRIDPASFPYSEIVWLNCTMGGFLNSTVAVSGSNYNAGWYQLNNATASTSVPNIHDWDYNTKDANGNALDFSPRPAFARKLLSPADDQIISDYSTPSYVLGNGWTPALAPVISSAPASVSVNSGQAAVFRVTAAAIPDATYQWKKNGAAIPGATGATYTVPSADWADAGSYSVTVTNANGSVTSAAATLSLSNDAGYDFAVSYGLDPGTNGAPDADPENDGISNRQEFFLGGNPTRADNSILPVSSTVANGSGNGGTALVFEFNRRKSAASLPFAVEYTANLAGGPWTAAVDGVSGVTLTTTPIDANTDRIKVTIPASDARLFARLRL